MTIGARIAAIAAVVAAMVGFEGYLARARPQVPFMDSLHYLWQLDDILGGRLSWLDAWYGGEHRGVLFLGLHLVEWAGWGVDTAVTVRVTGFVVLATLALWLHQWSKVLPGGAGGASSRDRWALYVVPAAAALLVFSPAGWELWLLNLGFGAVVKNLCIVAFLALWARAVDDEPGVLRALALGLLGAALILLASYGWSYAMTLAALVALVATRGRSSAAGYRVLLAAPLVAAQALYVFAGKSVLTRGSSVFDAGGLPALAQGSLLGAGSVLVEYETAMRAHLGHLGLMLAGVVVIAAFALQLVRICGDGLDAPRRFHLSIAVFGLGILGAAAFSRSGTAISAATASRYFADYQWLVLGTLGLACDTRRLGRPLFGGARGAAPALSALNRGLLVALLAAIGIGHAATWQHQTQVAASRARHFEAMRGVYLDGVRSEADAQLLQAPLVDATRGVDVAQKYALGPFRAMRTGCSLATANVRGAWSEADPNGARWMGREGALLLSGCGNRVTLEVYLPPKFPPRVLVARTPEARREIVLKPGESASVTFDAPPDRRPLRVDLQVDAVTVPRDVGAGPDERALGGLLTAIRTP